MGPGNDSKQMARRLLILSLVALVLCSPLSAHLSAATISINGSDTMVILAQKWAERYRSEHPEIEFQVMGGGSGTGFAALQNRTTHLATASRRIRATESAACIRVFHRRPKEFKVCLDGLSVYVHRSNPIEEITLAELEQIFTGQMQNWKELGGPDETITIYSRENSSGTYEFFKKNVLHGKDFSAASQSMPGTAAVLQAVSNDPRGIGYGGAAYGVGAKALKIKRDQDSPAYAPTEDHVRNRTYPIWRYLYIYVDPAHYDGHLKHFLAWILDDGGQRITGEVGYFPLSPLPKEITTPDDFRTTGTLSPIPASDRSQFVDLESLSLTD
jgi:phosphate transport system substrate-binding protein